MNAEELTIQRASATKLVEKALQEAGFVYSISYQSDASTLEVTHPELKDWHRFVVIMKSLRPHEDINYLKVPGVFMTKSVNRQGVKRMMEKLLTMKQTVQTLQQRNSELEEASQRYSAQKDRDFANVDIPDWMNVNVKVMGEQAGKYSVNFDSGSPMERLSASQVVRLANLLQEFE